MKKTFLRSAAIAVAVTGASAAHAVHVNPDGLGQVLLYPYYTVQNNFVTAIHIVNTTDQAKAVKVRFLEGKNSQEVLDFNLYLSPHDVWTGTVVPDAAAGAKITSADKSCIAPRQLPAGGEAFRNTKYATEDNPVDLNRRREGYVEVIEMGDLIDPVQIAAVTHSAAGVPPGCAAIATADHASTIAVSAPTGGLFGSGHLVSVDGGVRASYDPTALDGFTDEQIWSKSGNLLPSLEEAIPVADIIDGNNVIGFTPVNGIDAVSAVLTQDVIANEYTIDAGRLSQTDWIVTFPTKRFYVNTPVPTPFQNVWDPEERQSCHDVGFAYFDREEAALTPGQGDFSPEPLIPGFALCNEVNTLTLYKSGTAADDGRLFGAVSTAASLAINGFDAGWMSITFGVDATPVVGKPYGQLVDTNGVTVTGLPVIGFSASRNVNTVDVQIDGLNVYSAVMGENAHKGSKDIVTP